MQMAKESQTPSALIADHNEMAARIAQLEVAIGRALDETRATKADAKHADGRALDTLFRVEAILEAAHG